MELDILRLGHPSLREVSKLVLEQDIGTQAFQKLVDDLIETMRAVGGAGLAAPQVGQLVRLCVAEVRGNPRYPSMPPLDLRVWINPVITVLSSAGRTEMYEGCLSVPGLRGRVQRPAHIQVDSLDRQGRAQVDEFDGLLAAVAQHECDHLDGVLFVDRADSRTLTFLEEYEQFVAVEQRMRLLES
jgi:peptide deformylase